MACSRKKARARAVPVQIPRDLTGKARVRFAQGRSSAKAIGEPVFCGDVAELVDAADLKSVDFGRPGSIPGVPTSGLGPRGFRQLDGRHALKFQERRRELGDGYRNAVSLFGSELPEIDDMRHVVEAFAEFSEEQGG